MLNVNNLYTDAQVQLSLGTVIGGPSIQNPIILPYSTYGNTDPDLNVTDYYGNPDAYSLTLPPPLPGESAYTIRATAQLQIKNYSTSKFDNVTGVSTGPIDITVNATSTNVGSISGPLTLSSYHDGNINNSGLDKAGFNNMETGNPLHAYFGDTMLADLVIKVPPLPGSNWRYDSATLRATIQYPYCKPIGWGADVDGPRGNQTTCTDKTASFSTNTRVRSQENHSSVNDSIATFPVGWPTWRGITGIQQWNWNGYLTATWTQTYVLDHYEITGIDANRNPIWTWVVQKPRYQTGTSPSQNVWVTKTDDYYVQTGSVWEPWMK